MTFTVVARVTTGDVDRLLRGVAGAVSTPGLIGFATGPMAKYFREQAEIRFDREGDFRTGKWEPITDTTKKLRNQDGFPDDPINVRTGELMEFVMNDFALWGNLDGIIFQTPGTPGSQKLEEKLETAQYGNPDNENPRFGETPARPVVAVDLMLDTEALLQLLAVYVVEAGVAF